MVRKTAGVSYLQLKLSETGEVLNIRDNPFNGEINAHLHEFLLRKTAPLVIHYDVSI